MIGCVKCGQGGGGCLKSPKFCGRHMYMAPKVFLVVASTGLERMSQIPSGRLICIMTSPCEQMWSDFWRMRMHIRTTYYAAALFTGEPPTSVFRPSSVRVVRPSLKRARGSRTILFTRSQRIPFHLTAVRHRHGRGGCRSRTRQSKSL